MTIKDALMHALNGDDVIHEDLGLEGGTLIWSDDLNDFALDRGDEITPIVGRWDLLPRTGWKLVVSPDSAHRTGRLFDSLLPMDFKQRS